MFLRRNVWNIADLASLGECLWSAPESARAVGRGCNSRQRLITGRSVTIYGDGTAVRDYVYVDDVVDAFMCAGQLSPEIMGTYNIGTGEQTTVSEVYRLLAAAVGVSSPPRYAAARTGEVQAIALDSKEAREELGWKPSIKLVDGIQRTIQWLRGTLESVPAAMVDA